MKLEYDHIYQGKSSKGGWSRKQIELLGIEWEPQKGWIHRIVGKDFPETTIVEFIKLKDQHLDQADVDTQRKLKEAENAKRELRRIQQRPNW